MIKSFRDKATQKVWARERSKKYSPDIQRMAQRNLGILDASGSLQDLRVPPGNRLEKLAGKRQGPHSIRINEQWRVCFRWNDGDAYDVEITDYH